MTCKFQPVSVEAEVEQWAAGEPSIQRTSGKGAKRKRSVKDDGAPCPQKMAHDNKRVRPWKKISIPPLPSKMPLVSLLHETSWGPGASNESWRHVRVSEYNHCDQKDIPITARGPDPDKITKEIKDGEGGVTLESSDPSKVTAPLKEGTPALLEGMHSVVMTTSALDDVFAPGPGLQPELGRRTQRNHRKRSLGSGSVWPTSKVSLQTQRVGSSYRLMLGKSQFLKNKSKSVHSSCYLPATFHPCTWRVTGCVPNVFIGIRCWWKTCNEITMLGKGYSYDYN